MKTTNVILNKTNNWLITMPVERENLDFAEAVDRYNEIQRDDHSNETIDPQIHSQHGTGKCYDFFVPDELTQFHEDNDRPITAYVVALTDNKGQHNTIEPNPVIPNENTRDAYNFVKSMDCNPYFGKWESKDGTKHNDLSYLVLESLEARRVADDHEQTVIIEIRIDHDSGCLEWEPIHTKSEMS